MDTFEAEIMINLINDYWPHTLDSRQVASWARVIAQDGNDFDQACQWLLDLAGRQDHAPTLADVRKATRIAPPEPVIEDTGPPAPRNRGQAWARHVAAIGRIAAARKTQHDHKHAWQGCTVCTTPITYDQCGNPTCQICN